MTTTIAEQEQRIALAALTWAAEFPDRHLIGLLTSLSPAQVLAVIRTGTLPGHELPELAASHLAQAAGILPHWRRRLQEAPADGGIADAARHGFRLVCPGDPGWPASLYDLGPDRPCALWVHGKDLPAPGTAVAVDGTRIATAYGSYVAARIASDLVQNDVPVISGGGFGIEASAHRAALAAGGSTVAVAASGPGVPHPASHADLMKAITGSGGSIVTEQPPGRRATLLRYAHRSRLIAALSAGTVIVEATARGTGMSTARYARQLGRPVMAVPGPVTSEMSGGCHELIRSGAVLVTSAADVRSAVTARLAGTEPAGQHARTPAEVWILRHDDPHGDDISVHASEKAALGALAQTCRSRWDNVLCGDGVPPAGDDLDDAIAVGIYFRQRHDIESYQIYSCDVEGTQP
jgi:DNA processing protein